MDEKRSWLDEPIDSQWGKNVGQRLAFIASRVAMTTPSPEMKDLSKALLRLLDERAALLAVLEAASEVEARMINSQYEGCDAAHYNVTDCRERGGVPLCSLCELQDAITKARAAVSGGGE